MCHRGKNDTVASGLTTSVRAAQSESAAARKLMHQAHIVGRHRDGKRTDKMLGAIMTIVI
jgi:hypothetical protein